MDLENILSGEVLLVDKPLDWTSFQVVNKIKYKIKREFNLKKIKIGHAGTLDPKATGLLVVCTGKATKSISQIQDAQKEYEVQMKVGVQTESYDTEKPEINHQDYSHLKEEDIRNALLSFLGEIEQKPPLFSAIKIDGERAYNIARRGEMAEVKTRKIEIKYIEKIQIELPYISFVVGCSKGTYIRSLAHDIGTKLGVGAYLTQLRRTRIGNYSVENATASFLDNEFNFSSFGEN